MARPNRHAAEAPSRRRPGVAATAAVTGVLGVAIVALVVVLLASSGSGPSATDPSARLSAPNVVSDSPTPHRLPPAYVEKASPSARGGAAVPRMAVVRAGAPLRRRGLASRREALQQKVARVVAGQAQPTPFQLVVGTLNVLGSQHTAGGKSGYGPGVDRAAREASLIEARGLDLVGMQEVQRDQLGVFQTHLPGYAVFPGLSAGANGYRLQVAYKTSRFTPVDSGQVTYLFSHMWIPLPWLLLRDDATGGEFYVIDAHNSPEGEQTERVTSSNIEIKLIDQLDASHPVIFLGDLNETGAVYCRLAAGTGMTASNGASDRDGCYVPGGYNPIDWLMGTDGVTWSDDHIDNTTRRTKMSDHNLVYATASVLDRPSATG